MILKDPCQGDFVLQGRVKILQYKGPLSRLPKHFASSRLCSICWFPLQFKIMLSKLFKLKQSPELFKGSSSSFLKKQAGNGPTEGTL